MIDEMSVKEVAEALTRDAGSEDPGAVYLDVRTVQEFERGHVPEALNVPFVELDPATGGPLPNIHFEAVVRAVVPIDATVYCGCATGVRSLHAGMMLRRLGYERVVNVAEGFDGQRDHAGRTLAPGWRESGFPVTEGTGGERAYAALCQRALGDG